MRLPLVLIFSLTVSLVSGCSRGPEEHFSVDLVVDGQTVIKESAGGKKAEQLFNQHFELRNAIGRACQFARFAGERISHSTAPISMGAEVDKLGKSKSSAGYSTSSESAEINLMIVPLNGQVVLCGSGSECVLQSSGSQPQPQYGLEVKSLLQAGYGMKSEASFVVRSVSQSVNGDTLESGDDVRITGGRLSCKSSVGTKGPF
jgi:hypothetical protein